GTPVRLDSVSTSNADESTPRLTPDELTIVFESNGAGNFDIYEATRANRDAPFGLPTSIVNITNTDVHPWISSDRRLLFFAAPGLGSEFPTPQENGQAFYFASYEPRDGEDPLHQIWVATRMSTGVELSDAKPVKELASSTDTTPGWVSPDGCRLYFARQNGVS